MNDVEKTPKMCKENSNFGISMTKFNISLHPIFLYFSSLCVSFKAEPLKFCTPCIFLVQYTLYLYISVHPVFFLFQNSKFLYFCTAPSFLFRFNFLPFIFLCATSIFIFWYTLYLYTLVHPISL